jgi:hypothetical protein
MASLELLDAEASDGREGGKTFGNYTLDSEAYTVQ